MRKSTTICTETHVELDEEDICEAIVYWLNNVHDLPVDVNDVNLPGPSYLTITYTTYDE
jgi:hypothetical protein